MSNPKIKKSDIEMALRVYVEYAHLRYIDAVQLIADELFMNVNTVKGAVNRACREDEVLRARVNVLNSEGIALSEIAYKLKLTVTAVKTYLRESGQLRKAQAIEREAMDNVVPMNHYVKGVSTLVNADGETLMKWVKTDRDAVIREQVIDALIERVNKSVKPRIGTDVHTPLTAYSETLTLYPLADLHVGLYANREETGTDWNLQGAVTAYREAYTDLIARSPRSERAVIANLGDLTHPDNGTNTTPKSKAPLDVDGRYLDVVEETIALSIDIIDLALAHHERVDVYWMAGNHDEHTAIVLGAALKRLYEKNPRVAFPHEGSRFSVMRYHQVALGFTHGDTVKVQDLPLIMATDYVDVWANTTYRTWFTGHIHHKTVHELMGCTVESLRSPSVKDAWHTNGGYRSLRDIQSITFDAHGEYARQRVRMP